MQVARQTHLLRLPSGVYYFRRKVPLELQAHYRKEEIRYSLRTKAPKEAALKARAESLKWDAEFATITSAQQAGTVEELSQADIDRLASAWLAHLLEEDEEARIEGMSDKTFEGRQADVEVLQAYTREALAKGNLDFIAGEVGDFLESHGIRIPVQHEL